MLLAIATNIPVLLMTGFVVQGHIYNVCVRASVCACVLLMTGFVVQGHIYNVCVRASVCACVRVCVCVNFFLVALV